METINIDTVIDRLVAEGDSNENIVKTLNRILNAPITHIGVIDERRKKTERYQIQLELLKSKPRVEQRTPEWYDMRKNMITASDFAQALGDGKFGTQRQFYAKKSGYEEEKFNPNLPPLKWGVMFEPVAADVYSKRRHVELLEFGLLKHPHVPFFGASPDGITEQGIMVEIKCPFKRKITGEVPLQYYYQIQGQLDVCGLDECDYLECEFQEYDNDTEFMNDVSHIFERGIIVEILKENDESSSYLYSPITTVGYKTQEGKLDELHKLLQWRDATISQLESVKVHYWKLVVCSIVRVYKDDAFVREKLTDLEVVWNKILAYRADRTLYDKEIKGSASSVLPRSMPQRAPQLTGYAFLDD